ncbi:MAG: cytochrome C biogenesis protein, partial [Rhodobacterales bacterium CG18_big_fil_WC_8_21_14_2_50_71_9]
FVLAGAVAAVLGLCGSLFVRRRRWWVRAGADGAGRTVVEVAGLDRNDSTDLSEEMAELVAALQVAAPPQDVGSGSTPSDGAPPDGGPATSTTRTREGTSA